MSSQDALLDQIAKAVEAAKTEAGEVNAVIEKLVLQGYLNIPEATMVKAKDGRTVRVYLWEGTPAGDFALISGPDVDGRVVSNEELQGICKIAREMPQVLVELEAADPSIEQDLEETIERKARRLELGEIKAPPKGKKKTRVTFLAKIEGELERLEDYLVTDDGRSTRLVRSLEKKISEVYWPSAEWRDRILPRFHALKMRWEDAKAQEEAKAPTTTTGRGRPKADREIYINMHFMDGDERRKFGTLKGAQRWAHEYFGATPAWIEGDTVRNDDGGSLTAEGATLREIFPAYFVEQRKIIEEEVEAPPERFMYQRVEDAGPHLGIDALYPGQTQIWYRRTARPPPEGVAYGIDVDLTFGPEFAEERHPGLLHRLATVVPDETHEQIGSIKSTSPEEIFRLLQGERWSPQGEAREMIGESSDRLGVGHTSMSVGDMIILPGGTPLLVDKMGFYDLSPHALEDSDEEEEAPPAWEGPTRTVRLRDGRLLEVRGEGQSPRYWRHADHADPKWANVPFAGQFILASPDMQEEIQEEEETRENEENWSQREEEEVEAPASDADMMEKLKKAMAEVLPAEEEEYEYEEDPDIPEGVQPGIIEESIIVEDVPERVLKQAAPASDAEQMQKMKEAMQAAFEALDL